jgi:hypothetical protein
MSDQNPFRVEIEQILRAHTPPPTMAGAQLTRHQPITEAEQT